MGHHHHNTTTRPIRGRIAASGDDIYRFLTSATTDHHRCGGCRRTFAANEPTLVVSQAAGALAIMGTCCADGAARRWLWLTAPSEPGARSHLLTWSEPAPEPPRRRPGRLR